MTPTATAHLSRWKLVAKGAGLFTALSLHLAGLVAAVTLGFPWWLVLFVALSLLSNASLVYSWGRSI